MGTCDQSNLMKRFPEHCYSYVNTQKKLTHSTEFIWKIQSWILAVAIVQVYINRHSWKTLAFNLGPHKTDKNGILFLLLSRFFWCLNSLNVPFWHTVYLRMLDMQIKQTFIELSTIILVVFVWTSLENLSKSNVTFNSSFLIITAILHTRIK